MSILEAAIGLLAPPECVGCGQEGSSICAACVTAIPEFGQRCWRCNSISPGSLTCSSCRRLGSPSRVFICTNYGGLPRALVSIFKFGHQRAAATALAGQMARTLNKICGNEPLDYVIIPVPTATNRQRERGFGHTELLARRLSQEIKLPYSFALGRLGQARQVGTSREDRLRQLSGEYYVRKSHSVAGVNVLLIDDVVTTGGTIIAATQALRAAGVNHVDALLFAKRL